MKKKFRIIVLILIVVLGSVLGVFIYKKTNIGSFVEKKKNESLEKNVVASVAERTVTEAEARVYIAAMSSQIESIYGDEVWSYVVDEEGTKYSDLMKDNVLEKIIYIKLVCANADQYGVELTADDKLDVDKYVTDFFAGISRETSEKYNLTKELVTKIYEENILASKVYDKITLNYEVDADSESCRQARFVILKLDKYHTDSKGDKVYYLEDEIIELRKRAEGFRSAMKGGNQYQIALNSGSLEEPRVTCGRDYFPEEVADKVFSLEDNMLGDVIESEDAFYVVYCEEDNDDKATEAAIEEKILSDRKVYFNSLYTLWRESVDVEIDYEKWDKIKQEVL